jgi:glucan phosphorylase
MRLKQEMLLGIGGVRALEALGWRPPICHINEGHAAFAGLERLRLLMREKNIGFGEAMEIVQATSVLHDAHACSPPATMSSRASWPASISAITPRNWA